MDKRLEKIVNSALFWKYQRGGTVPPFVDCAGFVAAIQTELGRSVPCIIRGDAGDDSDFQKLSGSNEIERIELDHVHPGDVLAFNLPCTSGEPTSTRPHLAIYIGAGCFIHCLERGVSRTRLSRFWRERFVMAFRLPERTNA